MFGYNVLNSSLLHYFRFENYIYIYIVYILLSCLYYSIPAVEVQIVYLPQALDTNKNSVGIDFDCRERNVFWVDSSGPSINFAPANNLDESYSTLIRTGLSSPQGKCNMVTY